MWGSGRTLAYADARRGLNPVVGEIPARGIRMPRYLLQFISAGSGPATLQFPFGCTLVGAAVW
jgi:hypothetical protein